MTSLTLSFPYVNTPAFFSGTSSTTLVPNVFPVGIDGRPYAIDQKSGRFTRGYEPRVRDSQDISTAPGEAAINPGGLWRRGQDSWHLGAGQKYADAAASIDYRYYKSKGVNPWFKGELSLLNDVKLALSTSSTNLQVLEVGGYVYVADGQTLKFTQDPFEFITATIINVTESGGTITYTTSANHGFTAGAVVDITGVDPPQYNLSGVTLASASTDTFTITNAATGAYVSGGDVVQRPVWTSVTGSPAAAINSLTTDGTQVYVAYVDEGVLMTAVGGASMADHYATKGGKYNYTALGFAKGFVVGTHAESGDQSIHVHLIPVDADTGHGSPVAEIRSDQITVTGITGGQNAIYIATRGNDNGLVHRLGIKSDGTPDVAVVALELPEGEYPTAIYGYLGFIVLGTNKGVRFCTPDNQGNLTAGSLIATTSDVKCFTAEDRFVWFGYTNYDGDSGLGRLDLSNFSGPNTPAYATDLMYTQSSDAVNGVCTFDSKRIFAVSGIGVIVEDVNSLVDSGTIEVGTYRWGIPDRKFVAKVDTRSEPLDGSITSFLSLDNGTYINVGTWNTSGETENTFDGSSDKTIQASYKFELKPSTANVSPVMTRWMTRAYAAPFRSQVFSVPLFLHRKIRVGNKDYYIDTTQERRFFDDLIASPRIITLQIGYDAHTVIVEDVEEIPLDSSGNIWDFEGTLVVTMRSVEN